MSSPPQISTTTLPTTTTTTSSTQPPGVMPTSSYVYFSLEYLATFSGILKVICLVWVEIWWFWFDSDWIYLIANFTYTLGIFVCRFYVCTQFERGCSRLFQSGHNGFAHFDNNAIHSVFIQHSKCTFRGTLDECGVLCLWRRFTVDGYRIRFNHLCWWNSAFCRWGEYLYISKHFKRFW